MSFVIILHIFIDVFSLFQSALLFMKIGIENLFIKKFQYFLWA